MATPAQGSADSLYQDPTAAYAPALADIAGQEAIANQRYAQNKADLTNIFGSLSSLSAADSARIQEQFTSSIAEQRAGLAARTAEVKTGVAANEAKVKEIGAERGLGPGMAASPVAAEAEAGLGRANAYQQTWEGLLGANKTQAAADTASRQQGYALQQQEALTTLNRMLQDRLMSLGSQRTGLQGQLAQAQMSGKQTVLNAKYQEAQDALARQRAAAAASAASQPATYSKDVYGLSNRISTETKGAVSLNDIISGKDGVNVVVQDILNARKRKNAEDPSYKVVSPTAQEVLSTWINRHPGAPITPYVTEYVLKYYSK